MKKGNNLYVVIIAITDLATLTKVLDKNSGIDFWFTNMPNSVFIETSMTPEQLWKFIETKIGEHRMFISRIKGPPSSSYFANYYGRMPDDHWKFFEEK